MGLASPKNGMITEFFGQKRHCLKAFLQDCRRLGMRMESRFLMPIGLEENKSREKNTLRRARLIQGFLNTL